MPGLFQELADVADSLVDGFGPDAEQGGDGDLGQGDALVQGGGQEPVGEAVLVSQIRQLEAITGTALLHTHPGTPITLTAEGEQFARGALTVLDMLNRSNARNTVAN